MITQEPKLWTLYLKNYQCSKVEQWTKRLLMRRRYACNTHMWGSQPPGASPYP